MKPYDKIFCLIKIRPKYKGRLPKPKVEELNGKEMLLEVLWRMDIDELYPGEYALRPVDKKESERWFTELGIGWIASGDVE